jgi:alpha-maltose-1-phosphate synthase
LIDPPYSFSEINKSHFGSSYSHSSSSDDNEYAESKIEKNPSRVLLIDSDGLSQYTSYLARGLARYRDIIFYGFSKDDYNITGASKEKRIKFYWIKRKLPKGYSTLRGIVRPFLLFFILFAVLTKTKYDIVHIQEHLPAFFLFIPFLKLRNKQICWTLHDVDIFSPRTDLVGKLQRLFLKTVSQPAMMIKYSDIILVHAQLLKKQLKEKEKGVNIDKVYVIPHFDYGYLLESFSNTDNHNYTKSSDNDNNVANKTNSDLLPKEYVLFFGDVSHWKGVDVLVDSARIIRRKWNNGTNDSDNKFNVLIAGKSFYEDSYFNRLLNKEDDRKYIHILNKFITSPEIPEILRNAKFLVLPYTKAFKYSVSGVIPLAYTFSKPVIVSNVGSLAEYVDHGKTGFIFEEGNAEELADYIIQLLQDNSKCFEMGKRGYQKMMEEMSLERCCEIINGLYKENQHQ